MSDRRYDWVAPVYNYVARLFYGRFRRQTAEALDLSPGHTVLELACGTGLNLPHLQAKLGGTGQILGVDGSQGMLQKTRALCGRRGWDNVKLVQADLSTLDLDDLLRGSTQSSLQVDRALCTLGFSVLPCWQIIFDRAYRLLQPGGRFVIMDCHFPRRSLMCRLVDGFAGADSLRRPWEMLAAQTVDFHISRHWFFGGHVFVASGTKPPVVDRGRQRGPEDLAAGTAAAGRTAPLQS